MSRGIKDRLFARDSRSRRSKSLASESQERLVSSPPGTSPLYLLSTTPQPVYCPYCKQTSRTRVERSDSRTTKGLNALLWVGMGDPFALTAFNWCQDVDHFCAKCHGHLARKPYRRPSQAIPEDAVWELPLEQHHEETELQPSPDHVSELSGGRQFGIQQETSRLSVGNQSSVRVDGSLRGVSELPSAPQHDPSDLFLRGQVSPSGSINTTGIKPVELGSGRARNPESETRNIMLAA